jgi:hypothetical protein
MTVTAVVDILRRLAAGAVALVAVVTLIVAGALSCQTRNWQPVTVGDFKRAIHVTADRKVVVDHSASAAADMPQPEPPVLPAIIERIPPAVPRKDDDDDDDPFA